MDATETIRKLCRARKVSVTTLEKDLGFSNGSLTKGAAIRSDRLYAVAQYFGVSMEYLLTGERPASDSPVFYVTDADSAPRLTPEEEDLLRGFRACSQSDKDTMLYIARRAIIEKKGDAEMSVDSVGA